MYFIGILLLLGLLALCVLMLVKDGTLALPGSAKPVPVKKDDTPPEG